MALPKIDQPLKEEKILLIAQESKDLSQIILAINQIVGNCLQDVSGSVLDNLAMFDLEYLLINLRAKSVGDEVKFNIKDPETEEIIELFLDLNDVEIKRDDNHKQVIPVNDKISISMKYPVLNQLKTLSNVGDENEIADIKDMEKSLADLTGSEARTRKAELETRKREYKTKTDQALFGTMVNCIDSVVEGEDVYKLKDFTPIEIDEFVDGFSSKNIESIKNFFETMPKLRYEKKYKLKSGKEKTFVAEGTETFFI
jgi:hypothetical protein